MNNSGLILLNKFLNLIVALGTLVGLFSAADQVPPKLRPWAAAFLTLALWAGKYAKTPSQGMAAAVPSDKTPAPPPAAILLLVGLALGLLHGCGAPPEDIVGTRQALVVHAAACVGPTPAIKGTADVIGYHAECTRVTGSPLAGSAGGWYRYVPGWQVQLVRLSTVNTYVWACSNQGVNGPGYAPCTNGRGVFASGPAQLNPPQLASIYPVSGVAVGWQPALCPYTADAYALAAGKPIPYPAPQYPPPHVFPPPVSWSRCGPAGSTDYVAVDVNGYPVVGAGDTPCLADPGIAPVGAGAPSGSVVLNSSCP